MNLPIGGTAAGSGFAPAVDGFVRDLCGDDPILASFTGLTEWDHEAPDLSAAAFERRDQSARRWLRRFEQFDPADLTAGEVVDRELILARLGASVANADYLGWRRSPDPYTQDGLFELFVHRGRPEGEAVAAAIDRLRRVPDAVAAARANLTAELAHPRVLRRDVAGVRGKARFLREDAAGLVADADLRDQLGRAAQPAAQAYDELAAHVDALAAVAHGDFAYGERRYNSMLQVGEQLGFDVHVLRELGWTEYHALDAQMSDVAERINGTRDWRALHAALQLRHAPDMPGLVDEYAAATMRARQFVIDHDLITLPEGEHCEVQPAPAFLAAWVVASYFPAAPFLKGTPGRFNVPVTAEGADPGEVEDRLRSNCHHEIPATTVHEAYGGHHAHAVRMAGANPLRQFLVSAYFDEGWALYFEKVAYEQGFYRNDEEVLGWLVARIMRAARVVVDTSLHLGEMSIEQAATFMRTEAALPAAVADGEADRYAAGPTQASAYLTGAIAIERSRDRWLAEGRGSLREFHDALTATGSLPPGLAARAIGLAPAAGAT